LNLRIVMPVLNEGDTLQASLRALQPLRQRGAELVVVDGGSTDSTWALARALADVVLLAPRGRAAQMNAGASYWYSNLHSTHGGHPSGRPPAADGGTPDVLLFLHSDTQLPPEADRLMARAVKAGCSWGRFDVRIDGPQRVLRVVERLMNLRSRLTGIATGDQAMFVRRDVFERVGGFTELPLMEDIELSKRLRKLGPPACIKVPVATSARRWQLHGVWPSIVLMWRLRLAYFLGASPHALALRYGYAPRPEPVAAAVAILAKAPMAGLAKTRLIPVLGAPGAARAQRRFTLNTLQVAHGAAQRSATLWCAPDATHRFFGALHRVTGIACINQPPGDIGARMLHAFEQHFTGKPASEPPRLSPRNPALPLLLVGTDCPVLAPGHLQQAAQALKQHDVVLIPAEDGGYVLIGMRVLVPQAFEGIAWSTPHVMAQTRDQLRRAGVSWLELPKLWDVDEPADWQRLQGLIEQPLLRTPEAIQPLKAQT
jgi:rSAM/selenodomain-associated transferase 2/rSAM/selenodomain-associated transferase 1